MLNLQKLFEVTHHLFQVQLFLCDTEIKKKKPKLTNVVHTCDTPIYNNLVLSNQTKLPNNLSAKIITILGRSVSSR